MYEAFSVNDNILSSSFDTFFANKRNFMEEGYLKVRSQKLMPIYSKEEITRVEI